LPLYNSAVQARLVAHCGGRCQRWRMTQHAPALRADTAAECGGLLRVKAVRGNSDAHRQSARWPV